MKSEHCGGTIHASEIEALHSFDESPSIQMVQPGPEWEDLDQRVTSHELALAHNIQRALLPKRFPELPGFTLAGSCVTARQVGGDFFDVLPVARDQVLLVVADVMGKGVPAALFAATLHTLLRTMAEWTHDPAELLSRANRLMFGELSEVDMFITAQIALADFRHNRLTVASAGHCPLLIINPEGEAKTLSPDGMPLGIVEVVRFREEHASLDECSCALLYTDGLTEARNPQGEFFGEERLATWLKKKVIQSRTAAEIAQQFEAEMKVFQSETALTDDQTFLLLGRTPLGSLEAKVPVMQQGKVAIGS